MRARVLIGARRVASAYCFKVVNGISVGLLGCCAFATRERWRTKVARVFPLKLEIPRAYELRYYRNIWSYVHWNFTAEIPADADLDSADDLENLGLPS